MIGRVVLVSLLAVSVGAACKKKERSAVDDPPAGSSAPTGASSGSGAKPSSTQPPAGDKRVNDSTGWSPQTGPGFTVQAPGPATVEKVTPKDERPLDRYTFHTAPYESFVVEITELAASDDLGMTLNNMRMRITSQTQSVRGEDLIDRGPATGEVTGRDIWYVVDQDDQTLHARSKLLGKGQKIYEIRAMAVQGEDNDKITDAFVESFAFAP